MQIKLKVKWVSAAQLASDQDRSPDGGRVGGWGAHGCGAGRAWACGPHTSGSALMRSAQTCVDLARARLGAVPRVPDSDPREVESGFGGVPPTDEEQADRALVNLCTPMECPT